MTRATSAVRRVERRARRIVADSEELASQELHVAVAHEVALVLEQLAHLRRLQARVREAILIDELEIKADLGRVERLFSGYTEQEATLKARLLTIEHERRTLAEHEHSTLWQVYRDLLTLVQRYEQLAPGE